MRYKAVIFDLDGVICETDRYHYRAWKELADSMGLAFDETINNKLRGVSRKDSLDIILGESVTLYSNEEKEALAEKKNKRYRELLEGMTPKDLDAEVKLVLKEVKNRGMKIAIGSSSKNAKLILDRLEIHSLFDTISDGNNIVKAKPDPEIFLKAAEWLGIEPKDCLVVEDAKSGVLAAEAGGMDCAALGDARKYGLAKYNLNSIKDLLDIL
ncbi:MAG: beta-phosphoglucomutase [Anaerovoracaceae bacterium]|jgi:beta-phosphoglucomutase|nr:beta-phosphoglucomutase [Anaerovoracaceae bacterium]